MRSREDLEKDAHTVLALKDNHVTKFAANMDTLQLEVLLDIRDTLVGIDIASEAIRLWIARQP